MLNLFFASSRFSYGDITCIWHEESFYHFLNFRHHSCTEHMNNFLSVKLLWKNRLWTAILHDKGNLFREIFRDHFIGFINNYPREPFQWEMSFLKHLLNTSRCANDDISTFPKTKRLEFNLFTTNQSDYRKIESFSNFNKLTLNLLSKLSWRG